jgi:DNA-binding XRE family transcriptional regulator
MRQLAAFFESDRIRRMRQASGLNQQEAAYQIGLTSHMAISNWEVDRKRPSPRSLLDLWRWYLSLVASGQFPDEYQSWLTDQMPQPKWQEFGNK